jgi:hypothetical protein
MAMARYLMMTMRLMNLQQLAWFGTRLTEGIQVNAALHSSVAVDMIESNNVQTCSGCIAEESLRMAAQSTNDIC